AFAAGQHRLDVDDGRTVDGLEGADLDPAAAQLEDAYAVEADRVGPIGRARREDAGQRPRGIPAGMDLQHIPSALVQPGQNEDLLPGSEPIERIDNALVELQPGVGCSLAAL